MTPRTTGSLITTPATEMEGMVIMDREGKEDGRKEEEEEEEEEEWGGGSTYPEL